MSSDRPIVTDHAVLSYLERVCGVDVAAIRREIGAATAAGREAAALNGFSGLKVLAGKAKFVVRDGFVVTTELRKRSPVRWPKRERK